jgi:glutamate racemase
MAIGLLDSGVGGLTIQRAVTDRLPTVDLTYLADQAHMPYGIRNCEDIVELTRAGCQRLFDDACDLIVLACNTASAVALRRLQQSWLPSLRLSLGRPANVLGVVVPTIEVVTGRPWDSHHAPSTTAVQQVVGVFATQATARSQVYEVEIAKRCPNISVVTEPCPGLAALIEQGASAQEVGAVIDSHVAAMVRRIGRPPDKLILGSTHYQVVAEPFRRALPDTTELVQQPRATAAALEAYLSRHPEFSMGKKGLRRFLTTGLPGTQHALVEACWSESLLFESV